MSKLSYFNNINKTMTPSLVAEIHSVISENEKYAKAVWGSRYQDAIDATLHHALSHYSKDKGILRNYIISLMKNILKNSNKNEVPVEDESLHYHVDTEVDSDVHEQELLSAIAEEHLDIAECVAALKENLVFDYKFFKTLKKANMTQDYSWVLKTFTPQEILKSLEVINRIYLPVVAPFFEDFTPFTKIRGRYTISEILERYSSNLELVSRVGQSVIVRGSSTKSVYSLDLDSVVNGLIGYVYAKLPEYKLNFNNKIYYRSSVGSVFEGYEAIHLYYKEEVLLYLVKKFGLLSLGVIGDTYYFIGSVNNVVLSYEGFDYSVDLVEVSKKEV